MRNKENRIDIDRGETANRVVADWAIVVGAITLLMGAWAFFHPQSFFDEFPAPGTDWVSTLGDYNEHLMRDFGSAQVGLGLAAIVVGVRRSATGISAVMTGLVVFGLLHLGYHTTTFGMFSTFSAASQAIALSTFVLIPLVLLWALRRATIRRRSR